MIPHSRLTREIISCFRPSRGCTDLGSRDLSAEFEYHETREMRIANPIYRSRGFLLLDGHNSHWNSITKETYICVRIETLVYITADL